MLKLCMIIPEITQMTSEHQVNLSVDNLELLRLVCLRLRTTK